MCSTLYYVEYDMTWHEKEQSCTKTRNMDPLKCSLEWSPNFSKKFQAHLAKTEFSDVTLVSSDGTEFPGHRIILAAGAAFFESLLGKENNSSQR